MNAASSIKEYLYELRKETITKTYNLWIQLVDLIGNLYNVMTTMSSPNSNDEILQNVKQNYTYSCYRYGFPPIQGYTDDCGWGCTIRSAQMMIGSACLHINKGEISTAELVNIIGDTDNSIFSIQNIVDYGGNFGLGAGDWFTPSIASKCIAGVATERDWEKCKIIIHPEVPSNEQKPVLLLLCTRLGLDKLDVSYHEILTLFLNDTAAVGIIGGKKTSSYYFIGVLPDDPYDESVKDDEILQVRESMLVYLDPHELREHKDTNYHTKKINTLAIRNISPSMTFGFIINDSTEYSRILEKFTLLFGSIPEAETETEYYEVKEDEEEDFCVLFPVEEGPIS